MASTSRRRVPDVYDGAGVYGAVSSRRRRASQDRPIDWKSQSWDVIRWILQRKWVWLQAIEERCRARRPILTSRRRLLDVYDGAGVYGVGTRLYKPWETGASWGVLKRDGREVRHKARPINSLATMASDEDTSPLRRFVMLVVTVLSRGLK
ncbi:hypothetical protein DFP72DRAFT_457896 [Ephemerocybe angulata]|uniref:Uncharacterized protein n=1 Tax=Ephemerocybe angulata TaxID=980116 RepID=A0A8H6HS95_9AGAR|nr:hypothetical protein DFP72DRAFT_457896 [Tulosesus angulatus]